MQSGRFRDNLIRETFERAQIALPRRADVLWSNAEILKKLKRLLIRNGYLSESLIVSTSGMPAINKFAIISGHRDNCMKQSAISFRSMTHSVGHCQSP